MAIDKDKFQEFFNAVAVGIEAKQMRLEHRVMPPKLKSALQKAYEEIFLKRLELDEMGKLTTEARRNLLAEKWRKAQALFDRIEPINKQTLLLDTSIRDILQIYLNKFGKLAEQPPEDAPLRELDNLLDSLEYLLKVILEKGKRKV